MKATTTSPDSGQRQRWRYVTLSAVAALLSAATAVLSAAVAQLTLWTDLCSDTATHPTATVHVVAPASAPSALWVLEEALRDANVNVRTATDDDDVAAGAPFTKPPVLGTTTTSTDVVWEHRIAFPGVERPCHALARGQRYNHAPVWEWLVAKPRMGFLARELGWSFVPETIVLAEDLAPTDDVATITQPAFMWLAKDPHHRHVKLLEIPPSEHDWRTELSKGVVFQRRVVRPWLVDGRSCDVGVYVLVEGDNVHAFDDVLLRCAAVPYTSKLRQADGDDDDEGEKEMEEVVVHGVPEQRAVVIEEDYLDAAQLPSLSSVHAHTQSTRKALVKLLGADARQWTIGVTDAISTALSGARRAGSPVPAVPRAACGWHTILPVALQPRAWPCGLNDHFFELLRFDFIFNRTLHPHLVEVNASPNLKPRNELQTKLLRRHMRGVVSRVILRRGGDVNDGWLSLEDWNLV